jgi:hypothetical protein
VCGDRRPDGCGVDVGDQHLRVRVDEVVDQVPAHLADSGHADAPAGQARVPPDVLRGGTHPLQHAVSGEHRGVAEATSLAAAPGDVFAGLGNDIHVARVGAHVACGDVPAPQRLDHASVSTQQFVGLVDERIADHDRLPAAECQAGQRRLVGHAPGQGDDVVEGVGLVGVRVEASAAERRPEGGRVDRDDAAKAGALVGAEEDLLVTGRSSEDSGPGCSHMVHYGAGGPAVAGRQRRPTTAGLVS